jgi:hypothetical protein
MDAMGAQTIRQFLAGRRRKLLLLLTACWLGMFATTTLGGVGPSSPWIGPALVVLFAGFVGSLGGMWFFLRCPRCKGSLGSNNAPFLKERLGLFGRRLNYCPYCGVSLDEPYAGPASTPFK